MEDVSLEDLVKKMEELSVMVNYIIRLPYFHKQETVYVAKIFKGYLDTSKAAIWKLPASKLQQHQEELTLYGKQLVALLEEERKYGV